ncbi:hypothetical protein BJX66DRAFT_319316 [Aspergillus keveii]|uniref:Uncharacterized protein n=1 Tax=Aspergillus keveii TaxID=714993 RepID=A0ABR4FIE5_9EURO
MAYALGEGNMYPSQTALELLEMRFLIRKRSSTMCRAGAPSQPSGEAQTVGQIPSRTTALPLPLPSLLTRAGSSPALPVSSRKQKGSDSLVPLSNKRTVRYVDISRHNEYEPRGIGPSSAFICWLKEATSLIDQAGVLRTSRLHELGPMRT